MKLSLLTRLRCLRLDISHNGDDSWIDKEQADKRAAVVVAPYRVAYGGGASSKERKARRLVV